MCIVINNADEVRGTHNNVYNKMIIFMSLRVDVPVVVLTYCFGNDRLIHSALHGR